MQAPAATHEQGGTHRQQSRIDAFADFDPLKPFVGAAASLPAAAAAASAAAPTTTTTTTTSTATTSPSPDPAADAADAAPHAPSSRRSRRHRKRKLTPQAGAGEEAGGTPSLRSGSCHTPPLPEPSSASGGLGAVRGAAPWEEDTEADVAEQREASRQALRKAIRSKRQQRSSRQALAQEHQHQQGERPEGLMPSAAQLPDLMGKLDPKTVQAIMKKAGLTPENMPSSRKLRRAAGSLPPAYVAALMGGGSVPAALGK